MELDQWKELWRAEAPAETTDSQKLRALYASVEQEGIPDRFVSLLEQLDEAERRQKTTENEND